MSSHFGKNAIKNKDFTISQDIDCYHNKGIVSPHAIQNGIILALAAEIEPYFGLLKQYGKYSTEVPAALLLSGHSNRPGMRTMAGIIIVDTSAYMAKRSSPAFTGWSALL
jgi:hypothetical protein